MNVMKRAWEIAKAGQQKFGGKVKEYFAESLKLAWKLVKGVASKVAENFGFAKVTERNGIAYFALDEIEGLEVNLLTEGFNLNGQKVLKRNAIRDFQQAYNKKENKTVRIYNCAVCDTKLEIKTNGITKRLNFKHGKMEWA